MCHWGGDISLLREMKFSPVPAKGVAFYYLPILYKKNELIEIGVKSFLLEKWIAPQENDFAQGRFPYYAG